MQIADNRDASAAGSAAPWLAISLFGVDNVDTRLHCSVAASPSCSAGSTRERNRIVAAIQQARVCAFERMVHVSGTRQVT